MNQKMEAELSVSSADFLEGYRKGWKDALKISMDVNIQLRDQVDKFVPGDDVGNSHFAVQVVHEGYSK